MPRLQIPCQRLIFTTTRDRNVHACHLFYHAWLLRPRLSMPAAESLHQSDGKYQRSCLPSVVPYIPSVYRPFHGTYRSSTVHTWLSRPSGSAPPGPRSHADALSLPSVAAQCRGDIPTESLLNSFVGHPASATAVAVVTRSSQQQRHTAFKLHGVVQKAGHACVASSHLFWGQSRHLRCTFLTHQLGSSWANRKQVTCSCCNRLDSC